MKTNLQITAYFTAPCAIILFVMMPIFVTIYTRSYLRIRRFMAENQVYQNRGEADFNESPEYLKELFKKVLLQIIATIVSYVPPIVLNLSATIFSFVNKNYINSTEYFVIAHAAHFLL